MNTTKKSFFKGVFYIAGARYSGIIISIIITSILSRVLSPSDYGIIAVATVFITFFTMLGDMGLGPAVIQFKNLTRDDLSSIFGFSFWVAVFLCGVFYCLSDLIAYFYSEPKLSLICKLLSVQILFSVLNIVPNALLAKEKKFNIIAYRNITIQVFTGLLAIISAFNGLGLYSLLISPILTAILIFIVNEFKLKLFLRLIPRKQPIKVIFSFSFYQFLFGFINYFNRNIDKLIIGKYISVNELGYYEKSYRLMHLPVQNINGVMGPVVHPYLSDFQNDRERLSNIYLRMTKILINFSVILTLFLFVCSKELILLLFGSQWVTSILYFQIMSLSVISQVSSVIIGPFMQACNNTKVMFVVGLINTILLFIIIIFTLSFYRSTISICIAYVIVFVLEALTSYYAVSKYCFHFPIYKVLKLYIKPLLLFVFGVTTYMLFCPMLEQTAFFLEFTIKVFAWMISSILYLECFTEYDVLKVLKSFLMRC